MSYVIPIGGWVNYLGGGGSLKFRGGVKKNSLSILGLQRLASLYKGVAEKYR